MHVVSSGIHINTWQISDLKYKHKNMYEYKSLSLNKILVVLKKLSVWQTSIKSMLFQSKIFYPEKQKKTELNLLYKNKYSNKSKTKFP